MNVLHPDNKIEYREGDRVEVALGGDVKEVVLGTIRGISSAHVLDFWIVQLDQLLPSWEYSCITAQHTFVRPLGDNRPFLCEGVFRVMS